MHLVTSSHDETPYPPLQMDPLEYDDDEFFLRDFNQMASPPLPQMLPGDESFKVLPNLEELECAVSAPYPNTAFNNRDKTLMTELNNSFISKSSNVSSLAPSLSHPHPHFNLNSQWQTHSQLPGGINKNYSCSWNDYDLRDGLEPTFDDDIYRSINVSNTMRSHFKSTIPQKQYNNKLEPSRSLPEFPNRVPNYNPQKHQQDALIDILFDSTQNETIDEEREDIFPIISDQENFEEKVESTKYEKKKNSWKDSSPTLQKIPQNNEKVIEQELQEAWKKLSNFTTILNQDNDTTKKLGKETDNLWMKGNGELSQFMILYDKDELPAEIQKEEEVREQIGLLENKIAILQTSIENVTNSLQKEMEDLIIRIKNEKTIADQTKEYNEEIRRRIVGLREEKKDLERDLELMEEKNTLNTIDEDNPVAENGKTMEVYREYPPESTVIQNLLQAQVEFYFSDYNLKRDKRLLQNVIKEHKGFLSIDEVLGLARIRQLCSDKEQLIAALKRSKVLILKGEMVGRENFEKPREKEFPFRRTVFIFGIPSNADESFLQKMLNPFGVVTKVQFDHGADTLDRITGKKFLAKPRVYQLFTSDMHIPMEFVTKGAHTSPTCHICNKHKPITDGFYVTESWKVIYCAQCAARIAEQQLNTWFCKKTDRKMFLGEEPTDINSRKTALVVFASQRQASKCAYVRTRIAYEGAFATHFHHFSKVKKETAQTANSEKGKPLLSSNISSEARSQSDRTDISTSKSTTPPTNMRSTKMAPASSNLRPCRSYTGVGNSTYGQSNGRQKSSSSQGMPRRVNSRRENEGRMSSLQRFHPVRSGHRHHPTSQTLPHHMTTGRSSSHRQRSEQKEE